MVFWDFQFDQSPNPQTFNSFMQILNEQKFPQNFQRPKKPWSEQTALKKNFKNPVRAAVQEVKH